MTSVMVVLGTALALSVAAVGCQTSSGAGGGAPSSRGEKFFQMKCNACHPNGGQGAGPPIDAGMAPDFLERGKTSGRHAVPEAEWETLIAYINTTFGAGAAVAAAPVAPVAPVSPVGPVTPATTTTTAPVAVAPVATAGDPAAGGAFFAARCAKCHPGGRKISGAAVPGVLQANGSGKHGVPGGDLDNLVSYLVTLGAVRAAAAPAAVATPTPAVTATPVAAAPAGDAAAGGAVFAARCAKCHPGGRKIVGNPIPGPVVAGGSGKHGVAAADFENLMAYMVTLGAIRAGSAPVAAAPTGTPTTTTAPPPPPPPAGAIPMTSGMVPCNCACQCPPGAPPEAMPAACVCQCACAAQ